MPKQKLLVLLTECPIPVDECKVLVAYDASCNPEEDYQEKGHLFDNYKTVLHALHDGWRLMGAPILFFGKNYQWWLER